MTINTRDIEVMQLFSNGFSHKEIADYFDVSASLISYRIKKIKEDMVGLLMAGASIDSMVDRFRLPAEIIAEHISAYSLSQAERASSNDEFDRWEEIACDVGGIGRPEQTRNERRKDIDRDARFGAWPTIPSQKKPKRAGRLVSYSICIGCGGLREADDMFMVNAGLIQNVYVCQGCMEDAIMPLLDQARPQAE